MLDWWKVGIPAFSGILGVTIAVLIQWWLSAREKRRWHIFSKKEAIYVKMIELSKAFYAHSSDKEQVASFVEMIKLLWLYAPDHVIKKTYAFTDTVHAVQKTSEDQKNKAMEEFIWALRKDISKNKVPKKTKLNPKDYQHIRAS